jgi:hypothetical protein
MIGADHDVDRCHDRAERVEVEDIEIAPHRAFRRRAAPCESCDVMPTGGRLGVYPRPNIPARSDDRDLHVTLPYSMTRSAGSEAAPLV